MASHRAELKHAAEGFDRPGKRVNLNIFAPVARYWWIELVVGIVWLVAAVVVLKFNHASVITVGVLIGIMFLAYAVEEFVLSSLDDSGTKYLWAFFGVLLAAGGIVSLIHPRETFAGFADIIGFVFLVIGISWMVQAFAERVFNELWWMGLVSGVLMIVLAFWTSGLFFTEKVYTLLIFAGIWAFTKGITDIVRAFQIKDLGSV